MPHPLAHMHRRRLVEWRLSRATAQPHVGGEIVNHPADGVLWAHHERCDIAKAREVAREPPAPVDVIAEPAHKGATLPDFDLPDALRVRQSARAQLLKVAIPDSFMSALQGSSAECPRRLRRCPRRKSGFAVALCKGAWYCVDKRAILQDGREKAHSVPMYRREKLPVIRNACAERGAGALRWVLRGVDGLAPAEACLGGGPRRRVEQVGEHTSAALRRCARDRVDGGVWMAA